MYNKTSTELQKIFNVSRDDVRSLEDYGVLKPKKYGQGIASQYGVEDMYYLLNVKMYLLAGKELAEAKRITASDDCFSDEALAEQIYTYKRQIKLLEFIRLIKADARKISKLSSQQLAEMSKEFAMHEPEEYFDRIWDYIELVFKLDFLSQKKSLMAKKDDILQHSLDVYNIIVKILKMYGTEITSDGRAALIEVANLIKDEPETREVAKMFVREYLSNKNQIMEKLNECITTIAREFDDQAGSAFKDMMCHLFQFILDYFMDEDALYYAYLNFRIFINGLDTEALSRGIVRLETKRHMQNAKQQRYGKRR